MRFFAGTSGFSYKPWKGPFYPSDLPDREMLRYYATRLPTVEINNTFYRMPKLETLRDWAEKVPPHFRFVLKAPQRITHQERLQGSEESASFFVKASDELGEKRGPLLFQLPPFFRKDEPRLRAFLDLLPKSVRVAFEFRHVSWFDDDVYAALREHGAALCCADTDKGATPLVETASWGYVRLRDGDYTPDELRAWRTRLEALPWSEVFVFMKHEDDGKGPLYAEQLLSFEASPPPV